MAQIVRERRTHCPTGRKEDERVFEVVLEDDSALPADDPTPRTTTVKRIFSRGDLSVWRGAVRDYLLVAHGAVHRIKDAQRLERAHIDTDVSALGLQLTFPATKESAQANGWGLYANPARGATPPAADTRLDNYRARAKV